jgi:hypothetical protein
MGPNILYGQVLAGHPIKVKQLRSENGLGPLGICLAAQCTVRKYVR